MNKIILTDEENDIRIFSIVDKVIDNSLKGEDHTMFDMAPELFKNVEQYKTLDLTGMSYDSLEKEMIEYKFKKEVCIANGTYKNSNSYYDIDNPDEGYVLTFDYYKDRTLKSMDEINDILKYYLYSEIIKEYCDSFIIDDYLKMDDDQLYDVLTTKVLGMLYFYHYQVINSKIIDLHFKNKLTLVETIEFVKK